MYKKKPQFNKTEIEVKNNKLFFNN